MPRTSARPRLGWRLLASAAALLLAFLPGVSAAEVADVLLDVPWRTQIDGHPYQHHNAGVASLGMVLGAYGRAASTAQLREAHDSLAGAAQAPVTTASLSALAAAYGLLPQPLGGAGRSPAEALRAALAAGRPDVLSLGPAPAPAGERWVVAVGIADAGTIIYNDPGFPVAFYGQLRLLAAAEEQAWLARGAPGFALALADPWSPAEDPADGEPAPSEPRPLDGSPAWWRQVEVYARWFGLDPYYVAAVALAESGGDPNAVGDQGHSIGLMQLHDAGVGSGLFDLRYDPLLNLWHGTQALAEGMARYGDPYEAYSQHYNPGGWAAGERVMAWYERLQDLGRARAEPPAAAADQQEPTSTPTPDFTATPEPAPTATPEPAATQTGTPTPTDTATPTVTPTENA